MDQTKVLILSKDLKAGGGVVNFVTTLMLNFSADVTSKHFQIGMPTENKHTKPIFIKLVFDSFKLVKEINKPGRLCLHFNPSLNKRSLIRDTLLLNISSLTLFKTKRLIFIHGWDHSVANIIENNKLLKWWVKYSFSKADLILVLASKFKKQLTNMGVPEAKIQVTTTMFDSSLFSDSIKRDKFKVERFLFLSRFVKEKGIYELLNTFKKLATENSKLSLCLVGDGPEFHNVKKWITENHLDHKITTPGYLRGKAKVRALDSADVFIFPTYYGEGCPVSLLEAMAAGLPVITADQGGIGDIIIDGHNGILLKTVSEESIEYGIRYLQNIDPKQLEIISSNNREQAWNNYEAKVVTQKVEAYYSEAFNHAKK